MSGGKIGLWEGGNYYPCGIRRPSQHSMMRWLGFDFDQVGLEHMVARISGLRNGGQMNVQNTPRRERSRRTRSCGWRPATRASTRCRSRGGSAARPAR